MFNSTGHQNRNDQEKSDLYFFIHLTNFITCSTEVQVHDTNKTKKNQEKVQDTH